MDFTFLRSNGNVAFVRNDAEQAEWTQEECNIHCTFPFVPEKVIEHGMVVLFQDPAIGDYQAFEIRQCTIMPGDYYQQFEAESIAISELTDCHIPEQIEFTDISAENALSQVLAGTGWAVGTNHAGNVISSGDIGRGGVWQAVTAIVENWNVYITPRVTVGSNGITERLLDIFPSSGYDRGLRLAVNKNVTDPCVTYDDTELYTALYGYGGTYTEGSGSSKATLEYNFADVVWSKTADHPAKPAGQKYIEFPEKTALYGRNGRPRFGYYQNTNIKDPAILLQKTWESLKQCCDPKISITGTVTDLRRLGYADVPIRLHDLAIVELEPVGLQFYMQVIKCTVDLLDATKTLPTVGDYIPNIIYINRETEKSATGGGGGRGGRGSSKVDLEMSKFQTDIYDTGQTVGMYARIVDEQGNILNQAGMHIDPVTGVLVYAEDTAKNIGSMFHVQSDRITAEVNARTAQGNQLSSRITQNANSISLEVSERKGAINGLNSQINIQKDRISLVVTDGANPKIKPAAIVSSINSSGSTVRISADHIVLDGQAIAKAIKSDDITVNALQVANGVECKNIDCTTIDCTGISTNTGNVNCGGIVIAEDGFKTGSHTATWKSKEVVTAVGVTYGVIDGITVAKNVESVKNTIYYLGR